jgi:hypothetical protein
MFSVCPSAEIAFMESARSGAVKNILADNDVFPQESVLRIINIRPYR